MRLIDRDQPQPPSRRETFQPIQKRIARRQLFRRAVHYFIRPLKHARLRAVIHLCRPQKHRHVTIFPITASDRVVQRRHLILHQRNQRRHHHRALSARERRELIRQRLPRARAPEHARVPPGQHRLDDFALSGAKRIEAEPRFERRAHVSRWCHVLIRLDARASDVDARAFIRRRARDAVDVERVQGVVVENVEGVERHR
mmetsp:Transcript_7718/g.30953  ORF Transcript_7718/g.30953 Transcript_7718/m.30953 type:complete len:200 (-) Transcript_7718:33-632(-)